MFDMKTAAAPRIAMSVPLVARLHVDLCRCVSAACCRV
ncbi:hypothetical protein STRAU_7514 [Streptomyces aurantiacus JA 4570]|uniref:Uncharacterized protein n=1 Tax=Streptomyces aurantiacus JA 4570 TaxID=1286094 RepID=S3Z8C5_9ACTN|nr:hypothetical protein STRAU_7514 [Streptomyces aurantiacus JA 4570]